MEGEKLIGTFLYAASGKSYEVYHLVFTTERLLEVSLSWEKNSAPSDSLNLLFMLMNFPFTGPRINTDPLLMQRWSEIKNEAKGKQSVSYDASAALGALDLDAAGRMIHKVPSLSYDAIRRITLSESALTKDLKMEISAGPFRSQLFLVPQAAAGELKELLGKTPLAGKLSAFV